MAGDRPGIHVVAGVLTDGDGRVLITSRPPGKHLAGRWEFPGGKRGDDESRDDALRREFREELGLEVDRARPLIRYRHDYPELSVDLDVWRVESWGGRPQGLEGQALDWVAPSGLMDHDLLPADRPIVTAIRLPDRYLVTGGFQDPEDFSRRLGRAVDAGVGLVQLRLPGAGPDAVRRMAEAAVARCRGRSCRLLVNGPADAASDIAAAVGADGVHLPSRFLDARAGRPVPADLTFGASCHDRAQLLAAVSMGADFAVLGPVLPTASHPGAQGLGWRRFAALLADLPLPVYAIGGVGEEDLETAWRAGAQGVAGISAFW